MGNSLFDQLKKTGLVDKTRAQKVKRDQYKNKKQKTKKGSVEQVDEVKLLAEKTQAEKVERDRQINKQKEEEAERKAIAAQIIQLIETNRVEDRDGEIIYNFTDANVVKRLFVSEKSHKHLMSGHLSIAKLGEGYELVPKPVAEKINVIINLSGEGIADRLWTKIRKQKLLDSRIKITEQLIAYVARARQKPSVMISGSAVGYYGSNGESEPNETTDNPDDFAQQLCKQWEAAAEPVREHAVRLCILRTGLVIGKDGGFVKRMLLPFKLGLGGRLGDGKQWMSWIHKDDLIAIIELLLTSSELEGNFNATAPEPVTNADFSLCLAKNLKRPAIFPVPAIVLKLLLGEMSQLLLSGQKVIPERLTEQNFHFQFESLDSALKAIL